jgi:hypothetical protein
MVNAKVGRTQDPLTKSIFVTMTVEEVTIFFDKATKFLVNALNYGTFEGSSGSTRRTVMKLNLALDLLIIAFNVKLPDQDDNKPALQSLTKNLSDQSPHYQTYK